MSKNILLLNLESFKQLSGVHENVDDKLIIPEMKAAQDIEIRPALGSALYDRLLAGVAARDLNTDEQFLLDDYVTDALLWFTVAALPVATSYQMFTKGTVRLSDPNTNEPSIDELMQVAVKYKNRAEYYRERLIRYLHANAKKYPQFKSCANVGQGDEIPALRSSYTAPFWLGDD